MIDGFNIVVGVDSVYFASTAKQLDHLGSSFVESTNSLLDILQIVVKSFTRQ